MASEEEETTLDATREIQVCVEKQNGANLHH
jgi:hypothetical protein